MKLIRVILATVFTLAALLWLFLVAALPTLIAMLLLYAGISLLDMAEYCVGKEDKSP